MVTYLKLFFSSRSFQAQKHLFYLYIPVNISDWFVILSWLNQNKIFLIEVPMWWWVFKCLFDFIFSGIYTYRKVSIQPEDVPSDTNVLAIVITRWSSEERRNVLRDMYDSGTKNTTLKYKLLFLFNLPEGLNLWTQHYWYILYRIYISGKLISVFGILQNNIISNWK